MGVIMLTAVKLVDQWRTVETELPPDWSSARLRIRPEDPAEAGEVGRILGPMTAGRVGDEIVVTVERAGGRRRAAGGSAPVRISRRGTRLVRDRAAPRSSTRPPPPARSRPSRGSPSPGSTLRGSVARRAGDPAARTGATCWPRSRSTRATTSTAGRCCAHRSTRPATVTASRSRSGARSRAGYGASAAMAGRCFARCDEEAITGRVSILRTLSETDLIGTQGPAWRVGGKVLRPAAAEVVPGQVRSSAPKRSASALTMASRGTTTSSSVSVRSDAWNTRCRAIDFRSAPSRSSR